MGVTGMRKFLIKENFMQIEHVSNCTVLMDGSNFMYLLLNLHDHKGKQYSFCGGDYSDFRNKIIECFDKLKKCNIQVIVVLDGATPSSKLEEKYSRLERSLSNYLTMDKCFVLWNHLTREVFVSTLMELGVMLVQAPYEADDALCFLSYRFQMPILTNDTDFAFHQQRALSLVNLVERDPVETDEENQYYLALAAVNPAHICKRFSIQNMFFFRVAPVLIGNDYVPPLYDYFPKWRPFCEKRSNGTFSGNKDRSFHIRAILRWIGSSKSNDFNDFNIKLHQIIHRKYESAALKYIREMEKYNYIHLYDFPRGHDAKTILFSDQFQSWFQQSMEKFYSKKFGFELSPKMGARELNILLTKNDWYKPIPEYYKTLPNSAFDIDDELQSIIFSCLLQDEEQVDSIQPKICKFNLLEISITTKSVEISRKQEWSCLSEAQRIEALLTYLKLAPQHLCYLETLLEAKCDRLLVISLIVLRKFAHIRPTFIQTILICYFLPNKSCDKDDEAFYDDWYQCVNKYNCNLDEPESLSPFNEFQTVLSSMICLTRIMLLDDWDPSKRLSRFDGVFIAKLYSSFGVRSLKLKTIELFNRFNTIRLIHQYILTSP